MSDLGKLNLNTETSMNSICSDGSEKSPKISVCRFVERRDLRKIGNLLTCPTFNLFPEAENLITLFEKSCLSLVQENELDEMVSAIFLSNYPNVPAVSPSAWPSWMDKLYDVTYASSGNTLFVHLVVWDETRYKRAFLVDLLTTTFYVVARCDYVVLVLPPTIQPAHAIREIMTRVAPKNESKEIDAQVLYVADRRQFVPQFKFRMAVEEDNDDVIRILDNDTTLLREFYGDYYASELSRHPDPWRQIVIGDTDNRVATVACLNERIDLELLNDRFELTAFNGLRRRTVKFAPSSDDSEDEYEEDYPFQVYKHSSTDSETKRVINTNEPGIEFYSDDDDKSTDENEHLSISSARADAFALELLGFRCDEPMLLASSRELLVAAFECFPRLHYCLALMPTDRQHFPFLDHFTLVPLKPDKDFPMTLYVVHRASILHDTFGVREARMNEDRHAIYRLLDHHRHLKNILDEFNETLEDSNSRRRCYIFTCDNIIAGVAIVRMEESKEVDRMCYYYRVGNLLSKQQQQQQVDALRLLGFALAPIFQASSRFFLHEIMRLEANNSNNDAPTAMFYRSIRIEDAPSCLYTMQAVEPRIRNWPQFQRFFEREHIDEEDSRFEELFSLHVTSPRLLTTMSKKIVNMKIIVVGASNCGLSFIETLASGYKYRDLQFTDITLVSTNGLPYEHSSDYSIRTMIPFRGRLCHAYRKLTSGRMNCNVVKGTVVEIDRKKQQVYVEELGTLSYDYLVLTCGVTFQRPEFTENRNFENDGTTQATPSNYFSINDDLDAMKCLKEIKKLTKNFKVEKSIVFHGSNIECYCALAAFLGLGLEGSWITLIEPKLLPSDDIFNGDCEIRDQLREIILEFGVKLYSSYNLTNWKLVAEDSPSRIESVELRLMQENNHDVVGLSKNLLLTCDALLGFHTKLPCLKTFLAISRAGLVFDGRLVIDAEFRTNDQRIFAAGTMTKYSRRLRAEEREHKYFDSLQVGEKLAEKFVSITMGDSNETISPSEKFSVPKLPKLTAPIVFSCLLPGGYRYLHVRKPGPRPPQQQHSQDDAFTTGSCTADTGYFRLRLNQFRTLECVTCFSKTDYNIQNMIALYGKHEALLNDLKTRFLNAEIPDFYAYFREPWATALFADDFDEYCLRRKRCSDYHSFSNKDEPRENLFDEVMNVLGVKKMTAKDGEEILSSELAKNEKEENIYVKEARERLIEYLERHECELPMYSTPEKRRQILREIADKPLLSNCSDDNIGQSSLSCDCTTTSNEDTTRVLESSYSECHCSSSSSSNSNDGGDRANLMSCHLSCSCVLEG